MARQITEDVFKPQGTVEKAGWLSTTHINQVLKQYAKAFPHFTYIGCFASDEKNDIFDAIKGPGISAAVFNHDESHQPGSHWVAMVFDVKTEKAKPFDTHEECMLSIEYFDSTGTKPIPNLMKKIKKVDALSKKHGIKTCVKINTLVHQKENNECGVYSLFYILQRLQGKSFEGINSQRISDSVMNQYRNIIFRPNRSKSTRYTL